MKFLQKIKSTLDGKLVVFFTLLISSFCLIVWLFINLAYIHKQRVIEILEIDAVNVERALKDRIESTFGIAKSMNLQIAARPYDKKYINQILQKFRSTPELSDSFSWTIFSWSDDKYRLIVDAEYGIMKKSFDLSVRDYIPLTKSHPGEFFLGSPVVGSTSKKWMIPAGVGLVNKRGKYLGTVVIGFEIDSLARSLYKTVKNQNVAFELVGEDESLILAADSKLIESPSKEKDSHRSKKLRKKDLKNLEKSQAFVDVNLIKNKHGFLVRKLDGLPYFLVLNYDKNALNRDLWQTFTSRSLEILVMLVLSYLLLTFVYKTEKKRQEKLLNAKKAAEKANQIKDRILSSISHDIKNYIFGINGLGRIILDSKNESQIFENEDLEMIKMICDQSEELKYFVEDLIDFNQVEAGGLTLGVLKDVDIKVMINAILMINRRLITDHKVIVKTDIEKNIPILKCDPRRIKQILTNLITNAVKYSKVGGEVLVSAKYLKATNQLYLELSDHGFGMDEEDIKKYLHGEGEKIDKSEISKVKDLDSHGIGMSIVLRLVELHHGKIKVESAKGQGTKVKLYFNLGEINPGAKTLKKDRQIAG